jgi:hypothetical protein
LPLLKAKHWQIFLLLVVLFAIEEFPVIGNFTAALKSPEGSAEILFLTQAATAVFGWCGLLWLWSLGSFVTSVVPPALRLNKKFFRFSVIFAAIDVVVSIALLQIIDPSWLLVVIPLTFVGAFCVFYAMYFVAKSLGMAEQGERATFYDWAGPFLLLLFCQIGVWFIQPRVNRLYAEKRNAESETAATAIETGLFASYAVKVENTCRRWEASK